MDDETTGETPPRNAPGDPSPWALAGLGMQFFVAVFVFVYAGNWMDTRWHTSPLFVLVGLFAGGGGTFFLSYKRLMRDANSGSRQQSHRDNGTPQS
jgi:F0F1-type ATP synthase assembly protein I